MAATPISRDTRKGLSSDFPRLTGRAISLIAKRMTNTLVEDDSDPNLISRVIFLRELMMSQIWRDNYESNLPFIYYDLDYNNAVDNPKEFLVRKLEERNVSIPIEKIIEESLQRGEISFDPSPLDSIGGWGSFDQDIDTINNPDYRILEIIKRDLGADFPWIGIIWNIIWEIIIIYREDNYGDNYSDTWTRTSDNIDNTIQSAVDQKIIVASKE